MRYKHPWRNRLSAWIGSLIIGTIWANVAADTPSAVTEFKSRGPLQEPVDIADPPETRPELVPSAQPVNLQPLHFQVNYVYRPGGVGALEPLVEGSVLRSGDHYKIQFTPDENSYVYIFQIDSSQAVYRLFPMKSFRGVIVDNFNPVHAGVAYSLPGEDKSFKLDDQTGSESIFFLAFRQPNETLEQQYDALVQARQTKNTAGTIRLQGEMNRDFKARGVAAIVDDPGDEMVNIPWTQEEHFTMLPQRLDLCAECISQVTFEHR